MTISYLLSQPRIIVAGLVYGTRCGYAKRLLDAVTYYSPEVIHGPEGIDQIILKVCHIVMQETLASNQSQFKALGGAGS
jgi:hypothetical protein